jgi:hypothetical protein
MIWKQGSSEQELFEGMQHAQEAVVVAEDEREAKLILAALEELNAAAESFERAGRVVRAQEVTAVMMSLAKDENRKKSKRDKVSSKDEARKVFMFFGFGPEDLKGLDFSSDGDSGDGE